LGYPDPDQIHGGEKHEEITRYSVEDFLSTGISVLFGGLQASHIASTVPL